VTEDLPTPPLRFATVMMCIETRSHDATRRANFLIANIGTSAPVSERQTRIGLGSR